MSAEKWATASHLFNKRLNCFRGTEKCIHFSQKNLKWRDHLRDLGTDERVIIKLILKTWGMRVWTGSTGAYRIQWWAPVNMVMNLHILLKVGSFLTSHVSIISKELCSIGLIHLVTLGALRTWYFLIKRKFWNARMLNLIDKELHSTKMY
jgi:hypothetical protein